MGWRKSILVVAVGLAAQVAPMQPIAYSHKQHLAMGLQCVSCHAGDAEKVGLPEEGKCMACHRSVALEREEIRKLAGYVARKERVPWVRVYAVAAGMIWSHATHKEAGVKCETCHGRVAQMDRIERARDVVSMKGCMSCHKEYGASNGCEVCHEGK